MSENHNDGKPADNKQTVKAGQPATSSARAPRTASNMHQEQAAQSAGKSQSQGNARKTEWRQDAAQSGVRVKPGKRRVPRARRMGLSLVHVDPWSVAKVAFLLSVAAGVIEMIAVALIWGLLDVIGVFDQVTQIVSSAGLDAGGFNLASVLSFGTVLSTITILAIVQIVVITLLAVIIAALYNVVAQVVGGVHVTLGDD